MSIIDRVLTLLAPYECLGCLAEGSLLCPTCLPHLNIPPERCHHCFKPSAGSLSCNGCSAATDLYRVQAGTDYSGTAKELVLRLKFSGARGAAKVMAAHLSPMIGAKVGNMIIAPVPTAASRVRGRGYDQAKLLARELSRQTRLSYVECLVRSGHSRQVGTSRQQRLHQMHGVFRVRDAGKSYSFHKRHVLLIDDVMTTGATLEAAAKVLKAHGAGRVSATVFAQA